MAHILIGIAVLLIVGIITFIVQNATLILVLISIVIIGVLAMRSAFSKRIDEVVYARIIDEEPIINRVSEKSGYSIGYGRHLSFHDHYEYRDVITGYRVRFSVVFRNGTRDMIVCRKDSDEYKKLLEKTK